jgi:peptidoglycan hydrolase-like protein with peptidoglycan-binding domain
MKIAVSVYLQRIWSTLGWWYWLGTYGNVPTKSLWDSKSKQSGIQWWYVSWANAYQKAINLYNANKSVRVSDCVGLDKYARWLRSDGSVPYDASTDLNQEMLFAKAKNEGMKHGLISTMPDVPGIAVYYKGHIGFYVGNGEAIEAKGGQYGVIKTKVSQSAWTHWFYNPFVDYSEGVNSMIISRTSNNNHPVVKPVQEAIIFLNRPDAVITGGAQGIIGNTTEIAIKGIQKALGQAQDGIIGYNFLGGLLNLVRLKNTPGVEKAVYDKVVADLNAARTTITNLNTTIEARNKTIIQLNNTITTRDSAIKSLTDAEKIFIDNITELNKTISGLKIDLSKEKENNVVLSTDLRDRLDELAEQDRDIQSLRELISNADFENKRLTERITDLEESLAEEPVPVTVVDWGSVSPAEMIIKAIRIILRIEDKKDG